MTAPRSSGSRKSSFSPTNDADSWNACAATNKQPIEFTGCKCSKAHDLPASLSRAATPPHHSDATHRVLFLSTAAEGRLCLLPARGEKEHMLQGSYYFKVTKFRVTVTFVTVLDTYAPYLAQSDAARQACQVAAARAVPARGLATRSRAALGIKPPSTTTRAQGAVAGLGQAGAGNAAQRTAQNVVRHVPGSMARG
jgi:hypothetical protein